MLDFTVTTTIDCSATRAWNLLSDVRQWWLRSNPAHDSLEIVSADGNVGLGTELRIRERIAGIPGEAAGRITEFVPGERATWEAAARYRLLGTEITVAEGVTWAVSPFNGKTKLSAHVWARFPENLPGKALEWLFIHVFRGQEKDRRHAALELEYIRSELERSSAAGGS
jgi:hypothetical protein